MVIMLKKFLCIIKAAVLIAAFSWLASFCVMALCWILRIKGSYLNDYIRIMIYAFFISLCVFTALFLIYLLVENSKRRTIMRLLEEKGYCDEYYDMIAKRLERGGRPKAVLKNALFYNDELLDGERYAEAADALDSVNVDTVNALGKIYLSAAYLKTAAMSREKDKALKYYAILNDISDYMIDKKGIGSEIAYAKALYHFLIRDYDNAAQQSLKAIALSESKKLRVDARLIYALSLLKSGDKENAKKETLLVCREVFTKRQRENLISLMTAVEREYGI